MIEQLVKNVLNIIMSDQAYLYAHIQALAHNLENEEQATEEMWQGWIEDWLNGANALLQEMTFGPDMDVSEEE